MFLKDYLRPVAFAGLATAFHSNGAHLQDILQSIIFSGRKFLLEPTQGTHPKDLESISEDIIMISLESWSHQNSIVVRLHKNQGYPSQSQSDSTSSKLKESFS